MEGYTTEEAEVQARALFDAANSSPVRALRYELRVRAREWERAVRDALYAAKSELEHAIVTVGSVCPGMRVLATRDIEDAWVPVVRLMTRDGQQTLHVDVEGRAEYINFHSASSPVVVKS